MPLRGTVVLPLTVAPLGVGAADVGRGGQPRARRRPDGPALLQKNDDDEPGADDLHRVGTVAIIRQMAKAPTGMHVLVEGVGAGARGVPAERARLPVGADQAAAGDRRALARVDAHVRRLQELVDRALSLATGCRRSSRTLVTSIDDPLRLAYLLASLLDMKAEDKQQLLEDERACSAKLRGGRRRRSTREIALLELKGKIESQAQQEMTDAQRQYVLRQQLKAIQDGARRRREDRAAGAAQARRRREAARARRRGRRRARSIGSSG